MAACVPVRLLALDLLASLCAPVTLRCVAGSALRGPFQLISPQKVAGKPQGLAFQLNLTGLSLLRSVRTRHPKRELGIRRNTLLSTNGKGSMDELEML